ncbi:MAG: DUF58 domain-containing protein [Lentisphaerae bacterium]|nr:DUF58 domain-containing protein [Lentisphaerota bacterium]
MPGVSSFLTPADVRRIASLQVLARTVVEGFCSGLHRSPHKGFSVEFREHRAYVPGDEIRRLDWKIFARRDRFYVREFEEETNVRATILLDVSGSMAYGSGEVTKHHYATRLAACLAYLMLQQADGVGLVSFDTGVREYIPPRSRPGHLRVLVDALAASKPGGETELGRVFHDLVARVHRRGLLIVISDCFGRVPDLLSALAHFRHARHEVILFQVWDPAELEFPFRTWTRFESLERAAHHQFVDPATLREAYLRRVAEFREELKRGCHRHRVDLVPLVTDRPYADALAQYLTLRRRRA